MKKSAFVLSCCALALSATSASAAGMYVSGKLGLSVPPTLTASGADYWGTWADDVSFDTGMAINGAFGYDFNGFRAEAELGYQQNNLDTDDWREADRFGYYRSGTLSYADGDMTATTFFANGYYDFKNNSPFVPYLGVGIGYANIELNDVKVDPWDVGYSNDDGVFAYQLMAGVSYAINKTVALDFSYRYVGAADPSFDDYGGTTDFEFASHNFLLGARMSF
ncbi:MAG: outer membrane beta-barrel protein [Proteobacteria bacterium]|jgi:opacity protein-like surface antigen|nr:porin family protein [Desulfocapsa sp.]MBU3944689.1 outer membrane beta-barrel protein [Pseudomonadota bacterium]MCG2745506.1 outer membrane beta-barrel protein [Desulfobacteraceae bacterium]MBU3982624.1 outer membrane beta-barrel protein [Pseudomonadota bacterium]MBU4029068.1 outer membrane beta-barrel protein [Pseudomonadota bacterium]